MSTLQPSLNQERAKGRGVKLADTPLMLITGSSRGVGRGIAEYYLGQGYLVFGCSRGAGTIKHESYQHSVVDISDEQQVRKWITSVGREQGRIDILVNNAAVMPSATLAVGTTNDLVESTIQTNLIGTITVCREAAKIMMKRKYGRIITISTVGTALHSEGAGAYLASKTAVEEFSKVMAKELVSIEITCNILSLSLLESDMTESINAVALERYRQNLTIKQPANIEDVCNAISFFANPASRLVTGQTLHLGFVA